jgi:hypothetical protein
MKHHSIVTVVALLVLLLPVILIGCAPAVAQPPADPTQVPVEPTAQPTAAPTAVPTEEQSVSRWEEVARVAATQPVRMSAFLNETFGFTGGATGAGKIHYTTDGGATWTMAESSGGCLYGMDIVDE